ncbi:MAG: hypothetical protein JSW58_10545 [Candidatus Latescibacterota bacterium]|nr:MAG: hypothetical protein JSW58_10545 [Candidatus Latescibacterota bacterium]
MNSLTCRAFSVLSRLPLGKICLILVLVFVSSYCTTSEKQTEILELSEDEAYLVDAYVRIIEARDQYSVSRVKSDSLFAAIDSTMDTLRIANTIQALNTDPDRWVFVYQNIERKLRAAARARAAESEKSR